MLALFQNNLGIIIKTSLLSRPNQLISARSINLEQYKKYNKMAISGEYESHPYWIDDYESGCSMYGRQISGGLLYNTGFKGELARSGFSKNYLEDLIYGINTSWRKNILYKKCN